VIRNTVLLLERVVRTRPSVRAQINLRMGQGAEKLCSSNQSEDSCRMSSDPVVIWSRSV